MNVTVTTGLGLVTGVRTDGAAVFRGIPYAVTERFERPVAIDAWDAPLDATAGGIDCYQYGSFNDEPEDGFYRREFRSADFEPRWGENPMCLNIVAPEGVFRDEAGRTASVENDANAEKCPVLVFVHGGGFETGTVGELPYGASTAYAKRGVVLVSVGYRLNVFALYKGFNLGLRDVECAILWVRRHIADFGGDPSRITLIGQSAGSMTIQDLCWSRRLEGVVQGGVCMSGGALLPRFALPVRPEKNARLWEEVRSRAGARTDDELRLVHPSTLWHAWDTVREEHSFDFGFRQPVIDGELIADDPARVAHEGRGLNVPIIYGVTSQDFMPTVMYRSVIDHAVAQSRRGRAPVWGYLVDRVPPGGSFKAFHGVDLWYLFGGLERSWRPFTEVDRALSDQMIDYVANFARTGNPNGADADGAHLPLWPAITPSQRGLRLFDGESSGLIGPAATYAKVIHTDLFDPGPCGV